MSVCLTVIDVIINEMKERTFAECTGDYCLATGFIFIYPKAMLLIIT